MKNLQNIPYRCVFSLVEADMTIVGKALSRPSFHIFLSSLYRPFLYSASKFRRFKSSASNLPPLPDSIRLGCSHARSCSSVPFLSTPALISVCKSPQLWLKQHNRTSEGKKKRKKSDTMNSNLLEEEKEEIASFHRSLLVLLSPPRRIIHNVCTPTEVP